MNSAQRLWWEQAKSDLVVFDQLRGLGAGQCHLLPQLSRIGNQPRPTNGILVAITVMNRTFASKGRLAMYTTARAT